MTEIFYYHMTESRLDETLPGLLERSLERGWKVVVQTSTAQQRDSLDEHLWTFNDASFLPHGVEEGTDDPLDQPIWITTQTDNPNAGSIRFLTYGATTQDLEGYERVVRLFDGHDSDAVSEARTVWKIEKEAGHQLTYWQQGEGGRWEKKG